MKKTCSVLVTAYKSQDYILESIESIQRQTLPPDWKLKIYIGVDACVETAKVLRNANVNFYYSSINVGTYIITNTLIEKAKDSDIFTRFDSDDVMQEEYLYNGIKYTEEHGFFRPKWITCDENLVIENFNKEKYPLAWGQAFIRKDLMKKLGGYHPYRVSCDAGLIFRVEELEYDVKKFESIENHSAFFRRRLDSSLTRTKESAINSMYRDSILEEMKYRIESKEEYTIKNPVVTDVVYCNSKNEIPSDDTLYVVCFKWGTKFSSHYVNSLYRSLKNNLTRKHIFVCYTDDVRGLDDRIDIKPMWDNHVELKRNYRKLKLYDRSILSQYNYNVLVLDIDAVIVKNVNFLADLNKNAIWKAPSVGPRGWVYNSSIVRIVNDEFCDMYDQFVADPKKAIASAKEWTGSDQSIISSYFHEKINTITEIDGIISFRDHKHLLDHKNVKLINFYHSEKCGTPMDKSLREKYPWADLHWYSYLTEEELARESLNTIIKRPLKKQVFNRNYIRNKRIHRTRESRITKK